MRNVYLGPGERLSNLRKHGIDFIDAEKIFRGFTLTAEDRREANGELRFLTLGMLEDQVVTVAHADRGGKIRIISIRKATKHEARYYFSQITNQVFSAAQALRCRHCARPRCAGVDAGDVCARSRTQWTQARAEESVAVAAS